MSLIINNHVINKPIFDIINQIKRELLNGKLKDIIDKRTNILVTCPIHKDGKENRPSCQVYAIDDDKIPYGTCHCFTCGFSASLSEFVNACFNESGNFGNEWLVQRFGDILISKNLQLQEIDISQKNKTYLDKNILKNFDFYNDYMFKRKLTKDIIDKFKVGFDKKTQCITFPVFDENENLVMITKRSINSKNFYIDKNCNKPVYLLYDIMKNNIKTVYVTESQINALTLQAWGFPAIALFGTGSKYQYDILKRSGIRNYILCFDGDNAGDKGAKRFKDNMPKNIIIMTKQIPKGKDVNDLEKQEFIDLPMV